MIDNFIFRMKVKLRDKLLLGENINKFVRKASNPENFPTALGLAPNRKQLSHPLSPQRKQQSNQLVKHPTEKESQKIPIEKLERMLQRIKTPLTSRLLVEEERDVRQLSAREREERGPYYQKELQVYGIAKFRKTNWRQGVKDKQQEKHREKIKQLFSGSPRRSSTQGLKDHSKTNTSFYKDHLKPWDTIRLNGVAVELSPQRKKKKLRNTSSLFYKTLYG